MAANNQHDLGSDVTKDPKNSSFFRAMALARGTVSIVDRNAVTYSRIWCGFEVSMSLQLADYLYDMVTFLPMERQSRISCA